MISRFERGGLDVVLKGYPLSSPEQVVKYRSVYFLTDPSGQYVVKPLKTGAIRSFLIGELLTETVRFPLSPDLISPGSGRNYLWNRGNRYLVTRMIEGDEADYLQTKDMQAAIRTMAAFHSFSKKLTDMSSKWSFFNFDPQIEWEKYLREMAICRRIAIRRSDDWSRRYLRLWSGFYDQACRAIEEYATVQNRSWKCLCYHDWAFHNLVIRDDNAFLIDFDYMLLDHATHDKANLISRYLRLYRWDPQYLLKILWNFDRFYPWKHKELSLLRVYLTFPYDFWMFGRQYFLERLPWGKSYVGKQWERKIALFQARRKCLEILKTLE